MEAPDKPVIHGFVITYDLIKEKDYRRLIDELKRLGCRHELLSAWVLPKAKMGNYTAATLIEHLESKFLDDDDEIVVIGIGDYEVRTDPKKREARSTADKFS